MRLIIAEKPSVAMDIARALGSFTKHDGYLTVGTDTTITWAYGHLLTLADPEQYHAEWKRWSWPTLPMMPERFELTPVGGKTRSQLRTVVRLIREADSLAIGTDGDREGELIGRYLLAYAQVKKPTNRLWLSENTAAAIRQALAVMKPAKAYDSLAKAAQARAQADWLVGLNATRAFSLRHGQPGQPLSVGRVQTPTLRLIVDRDTAIDHFEATPYWEVHVTFDSNAGSYVGVWQGRGKERPARISTEGAAHQLLQRLSVGTPGTLDRMETKKVVVSPPHFYNLNDLQKEAHRRLGLTAQQTLDAAQRLYDHHLTSYPRTEARVITQEIAKTLPERIKALAVGTPDLRTLALKRVAAQQIGRLVNDAQVAKAGHYAIIPTGQRPSAALTRPDQAVYDLISRRFLAALLPPGEDARTMLWTVAAGESFKTTGTAVIAPGWRAALEPLDETADDPQKEREPDQKIPAGLTAGDAVQVATAQALAKQTKPPARLNDASLLALMEKHGLGTPATRARIVEVLLTRAYVERAKKTLVSTDKGRQLLRVVPELIQSPDLTGTWEARLEAIADEGADVQQFMQDIRAFTQQLVDVARQQEATPIQTASDLGACPVCKTGQIRETRKGWGCSRYRDGCVFTIWRHVAGKSLTLPQVKLLLAGKTTRLIKGFQSKKTGKSFDAQLKLEGPNAAVTFVFPERTAPRPS